MFYSKTLKKISPASPPQCDTSFCLIASPWVCPGEDTHQNNTGSDFEDYYQSTLTLKQNHKVQWSPNRTDRNNKWVYVYKLYKAGSDVKLGGEYGWVPKEILNKELNPEYYNYNILGGRDNQKMLLPYVHDVHDQPFKAQKTILNNIKQDLGVELEAWDLCSRACVYDQLYNLSFVSKNSSLKLNYGRSWEEVVNILSHTQTFNLLSGQNLLSFSKLPNTFRTAKYVFKNSPITRVSCDISSVIMDASLNNGEWTYMDADGISKEWNLQTDTTYIVESSVSKFWVYKIVNLGDYICAHIDVKIIIDHPYINNNTIKINYLCLVDREPESC